MSAATALRTMLAAIAVTAALTACGSGPSLAETACPPSGTKLTYASFGKPFFDRWCSRCHDASEGERQGAPATFVFATRDAIAAHASRIFDRSAGANTSMPPGPDDPPLADRDALAEWLACGVP